MVTDLLTYLLPLPMLWRLKLPVKQRIGLMTMLGLGLLYESPRSRQASADILPVHVLQALSASRTSQRRLPRWILPVSTPYGIGVKGLNWYETMTGTTTDPTYWSEIEVSVAILAVSIPSFKPAARRYFPRLVGSDSPSRSDLPASTYGSDSRSGHLGSNWTWPRHKPGHLELEQAHERGHEDVWARRAHFNAQGDMTGRSAFA